MTRRSGNHTPLDVGLDEYLKTNPGRVSFSPDALGEAASDFLCTDPYFRTRPDLMTTILRVRDAGGEPKVVVDWDAVETVWLAGDDIPLGKTKVVSCAMKMHTSAAAPDVRTRAALGIEDQERLDSILGGQIWTRSAALRTVVLRDIDESGTAGLTLAELRHLHPDAHWSDVATALSVLTRDGDLVRTDRLRDDNGVYVAAHREHP